jgi:hypothetical protein
MASDGKQLEVLVAFVEDVLRGGALSVKTNSKVCNDEGIQVAEFDVEVSSNVRVNVLPFPYSL